MDVKIETVGPCKKKVRIELPADKIDEEFEKNYRELNQSVVVPGFRRGKAPRRLMERRFGEQVSDQVKATLLSETLQEALQGQNLHPISDPDLDVESIRVQPKSPLVLEFEVEVRPEFELRPHTGLEVERHTVQVAEDEIDEALRDLATRHAEEVPVDQDATIARGDRLLVDLSVAPAEDAHEHGEDAHEPYVDVDENMSIVVLREDEEKTEAGQRYYPATAFVGKRRGDRVEGQHPDEKHGDHVHPGGKWSATIKEVKRYRLPAVDEDFAREMDCADLAELRSKIREEIAKRKESEEDRAVERRVIEKLVDAHEIELPDSFVEHALRDIQERRRFAGEQEGLAQAQIDQSIEASRTEDVESLRRELKGSLILDRISEEQGLNVTEDEVDQRIEKIAQRQRRWPNEIRRMLESEGVLDDLRRELRIEKARVFLRESAKVQVREAPETGREKDEGKSK